MTHEELQELTQHLIDVHETVTGHLTRRPRKAAKDLCQEFRVLQQRGDFWNQFEKTAKDLEQYRNEADQILNNVRKLTADEAQIFSRLGVDDSQIGNVLSSVCCAVSIAEMRTADMAPLAIRNLQERLNSATQLICKNSRGPILHAVDFVVSKKGALALAGLGLATANIWFGGDCRRWRVVARVNEGCGGRCSRSPWRHYRATGLRLRWLPHSFCLSSDSYRHEG